MDCSLQSLVTNSTGIECCIRGRRQINAIKVWLLATIAGVSTDPDFLRDQAKCLGKCVSPTTLLGFNAFLTSVLSGAGTDTGSLANNARCFRQPCIHGSLRGAMQIWILTQIAGTTADPTTLLNNAKCIMDCIPAGELCAVETWLLTQLAGVSADPTSLAASSNCFNCLNSDELDAIYTQLLCQSHFSLRSDLQLWVAADQGINVVNQAVSQWNDLSLKGLNLTQGTAGNRPWISRSDQQMNTVLQSEDFTTTWTRTAINAFGATDTGGAGAGSFSNSARSLDPQGTNKADFVQEDATNGTHLMLQTLIGCGAAMPCRCSVYAKASGRTWIRVVLLRQGNTANFVACYFDITNGVVGTAANGGTGANAAGSIQSMGNGWFRCTVTGTPDGVDVGVGTIWDRQVQMSIRLANADGGESYQGDNTSGAYLFGAQVQHSENDSSYLTTTTVPFYPGRNGMPVVTFNLLTHTLNSAAVALSQPISYYAVIRQIGWQSTRGAWDGLVFDKWVLQQANVPTHARLHAGNASLDLLTWSLGEWAVISGQLNGSDSRIVKNSSEEEYPYIAGANSPDGFTLGNTGSQNSAAFTQIAEWLVFNSLHDLPTRTEIKSYLAHRWGISL